MEIIHIFGQNGTKFPAGRMTRVLLGENGVIHESRFCQGYVVIYPGGSVPLHEHMAVETYTILQGSGSMTVDGEISEVGPGDLVYIDSGKPHSLRNTGEEDMHMMFVYSPGVTAEHWAQETAGELH